MPVNITPKEGFLYYQYDNGEWIKMGDISDIDITEECNNVIEPLPFINLNQSFTITLHPPEIVDAEAVEVEEEIKKIEENKMRDRSTLRKNRLKAIRKRKKLLKSVFNFIPECDGHLTNNHECQRANYHNRKTNTRKDCASYRHHGGYGKDMKWSPHDERQINDMEQQIKEYL